MYVTWPADTAYLTAAYRAHAPHSLYIVPSPLRTILNEYPGRPFHHNGYTRTPRETAGRQSHFTALTYRIAYVIFATMYDVRKSGPFAPPRFLKGRMGAYAYEQAVEAIQQLSLPMDEIEQQIRRTFPNILTHNHDDHIKNIAFLMSNRANGIARPCSTWRTHSTLMVPGPVDTR